MKIFKKKKKAKYTFLCKTCDVFFVNFFPYKNECPICGCPAEIYSVEKLKEQP